MAVREREREREYYSSEKGAITLYVSIVCLFILIVGVVAYIGAANKQAMQMAELNRIEATYNNQETTAEDIYSEYDGGDIVPIYTPEQFAKVGSGEEVYVAETGKFYTFSVDKTYMFYGVPEDLELLMSQLKEEIKEEVNVGIGGGNLGVVKVGVLTLTKNTNQLANSVTITATASSEKGIMTFVTPDKIEKLYESGTTEIEETYEITSNGTYTFKVVEADGTISDAQIVITNVIGTNIGMQLSTEDWTTQDVIVTVTWPDGSESGIKEVKVDDGSWTRYTGLQTKITMAQNGTVYARVTNGIDEMKTSEVAVGNIDKNPAIITPVATTIECGEIKNIEECFEIEQNGDSPYSKTEYYVVGWNGTNVPITNTSVLTPGSTVKCKVTKESGTVVEQTGTITVNRLSGTLATNTTIKPSASSNVQIVIPAGFAPAILEGSNSTTSEPGQSGKVKSIMPQSQWNSITVDQINKGIVVVHQKLTYDGGKATGTVPDYDEYVWVPIPESSNFATTAFRNETLGSSGYWDDTSTVEYTNMVSSVNANKGFYISRYEASKEIGSGVIARSRRSSAVWNKVSQIDSKTYSSNVQIANAHLIYGIEWDSVMNWLVNSKATIGSATVGTNKEITLSDISSDSRSWGNYNDSIGDAATGKGSIQTTSYNEYWKANNIYDLAGNIWEWTQEKYLAGNRRVYRGGCYTYDGLNAPAGYRNYYFETDIGISIGFRFSFYL